VPDFAAVLDAKQRAKARLFAIPGVHAVGIGHKWVAGTVTGQPSVIVLVEKKKSLSEVALNEVIPPEVEGIPTDVFECGIPVRTTDTIKHRPLTGGIQIEGDRPLGEAGTLGCFASVNANPQQIVAITNQHVVASVANGTPTNLTVTLVPGPPTTITIGGTNTPGSLFVVGVSLQQGANPASNIEVFYKTSVADDPTISATILTGIINSKTGPGLTATVNGPVITLTPAAGVSLLRFFGLVFGPRPTDPASRVHATVTPDPVNLTDHTVSITGTAARDGFASAVADVGGTTATQGFLVLIAQNDTAAAIAKKFHDRIGTGAIPGITSDLNGSDVVIHNAQNVEFDIHSDRRVGQPDAGFPSACGVCLDKVIGTVSEALIQFDIAMVQLTPGLQYIATIPTIGPITGPHNIQPAETGNLHVFTRGRTTDQKSEGIVMALNVDGHSSGGNPPLFHHHFTDAVMINGIGTNAFSAGGDSGSAVVVIRNDPNNPATELHEVAAILFSAVGTTSFATPIADVTGNLHVTLETAASANDVKTVPGVAPHVAAPIPHLAQMVEKAEQQMLASPEGEEVLRAVRQHAAEAQLLVNTNRRVATVWQRNGGPELLNGVLGQRSKEVTPGPVEERLRRIQAIFERYASAAFADDLQRFGAHVIELIAGKFAIADRI
jgi:hypothetical protein